MNEKHSKTRNCFHKKRDCGSVCILFLMLSFLAACRQELEMPPVIISTPVCTLSSPQDTFHHAGLVFECQNISSRQIVSLEVAFVIYKDKTGGNPFYGSNVGKATVSVNLAPSETGRYEINLDLKLALIPEEPFHADYFRVCRVVFEDGSDWSDPYGIFYPGSLLS